MNIYTYIFIYKYLYMFLLTSCWCIEVVCRILRVKTDCFLGLGGWGGDLAREFSLKECSVAEGVQCFGMHKISSFTIKLWNFMWFPSISQVKFWNPPIATNHCKMDVSCSRRENHTFILISWQNGILRSKRTVVHTGWSKPNNKIHKSQNGPTGMKNI